MTDHDNNLIESKQSRGMFYCSYLGVDIDRMDNKQFYASIWSDEYQQNMEFVNIYYDDIIADLNYILAQNYFASLQDISKHFNHVADYNNPEQNCTNLIEAIQRKLYTSFTDPTD